MNRTFVQRAIYLDSNFLWLLANILVVCVQFTACISRSPAFVERPLSFLFRPLKLACVSLKSWVAAGVGVASPTYSSCKKKATGGRGIKMREKREACKPSHKWETKMKHPDRKQKEEDPI